MAPGLSDSICSCWISGVLHPTLELESRTHTYRYRSYAADDSYKIALDYAGSSRGAQPLLTNFLYPLPWCSLRGFEPRLQKYPFLLESGEFKRGAAPLNKPPFPSSAGWKGGQASNEDLLPLGYGVRKRVRVMVKKLYNNLPKNAPHFEVVLQVPRARA
jgi:hypothetical protein